MDLQPLALAKRKGKGKTKSFKGYNHYQLFPKFPELATAFLACIIDRAQKEKAYSNLLDSYLAKYIEKTTGSVRAVPLERILEEVMAAGYRIEFKLEHKTGPIGSEFPPCPWDKKRVAAICLGGRFQECKNSNVGRRMFDKDVYMIEDWFYAVVDNQEDWPVIVRPELKHIEWQTVPNSFEPYGYLLLKAKVKPEYFLYSKIVTKKGKPEAE